MISHRRAELLVAEAIDFDLAAADARQVAEHLATCPAGAAHAAALHADAERVRQLPRHHAPPRVRAAVEQAAGRPAAPGRGRVQLLLAAALLLLLLLGAALLLGSRLQRPDNLIPDWAVARVEPGVAGAAEARMQAVAWGEDGFVAVGATPLGPASWYSADGVSWNHGEDLNQPAGLSLIDVVAVGAGYAALGIVDGKTTVCESQAGRRWVCSQPSNLDGMGRAIASHDGDIVVVGARPDIGGAVWYRPGNAAWREAAIRPNLTDELAAVGWTASGFVAAGAEIFSSPDGRSWTLQPSARSVVVSDLVTGPGRLVIVGTGGGRPQALAGTGVHDLELAPAAAASGAMFGVVFASGRFIAVGDGPGGAMAWTSADGWVWTAGGVAGEAGSRMVDVATDGERVVAVGSRGTEAAGWRYGEKK